MRVAEGAARPAPPSATHPHPPPPPPPSPGPKDYLNAALITLGCTLFLMTGSVKSKHAGTDSSLFGLALMLGYLGFDGFTSTFQDKLFKARLHPPALPACRARCGCCPVAGRACRAGAAALPPWHCGGGSCCCPTPPRSSSLAPALAHPAHPPAPRPLSSPHHHHHHKQGYQMTIYNQILYVTCFSATFSCLGLLSAGQLGPALRCGRGAGRVRGMGRQAPALRAQAAEGQRHGQWQRRDSRRHGRWPAQRTRSANRPAPWLAASSRATPMHWPTS